MGIMFSLFIFGFTVWFCNCCYKIRHCLGIAGLISNLIMISLLILEIFIIKRKKIINGDIIIICIYFIFSIISLIIHILLIIFKKKYFSYKIIKVLYGILLFTDAISSIINFVHFLIVMEEENNNKNVISYVSWIFDIIFGYFIGIHFYFVVMLYYFLSQLIKEARKSKTPIPIDSSINLNMDKKFYFNEENNIKEEIFFSEEKTVEKLLSKYIKKYKPKVCQNDLYFSFKDKRIDIQEKSTIKNYFELLDYNQEITIDVKVKDKINIKIFKFDGIYELKKEVTLCIYETVEKLISEYLKKIELKIDKKNMYFFFNNKKIDINGQIIIQKYFNFNKEIIIQVKIKDKINIKKFIFNGIDDLKEEISMCIYETVENLISEYLKKIKLKIDKKISIEKIFFVALGDRINKNVKKLIENYFKIDLSVNEITILVYYLENQII